jgi:hypothetical protein
MTTTLLQQAHDALMVCTPGNKHGYSMKADALHNIRAHLAAQPAPADEIDRLTAERDALQVEYDHAVEQAAKNCDEVLQLREYLDAAQRRGESLRERVAGLREWIRDTGLQTDICTRNILGEVCPYCQCGRAALKGER